MNNRQPVFLINGKFLYYTFVAGASRVLQNQAELNRINVFPVNDKDTGTNLASTVRAILDSIRPDRSFTATANRIAEAALIGARGNSGIIFAQLFYGLSLESADKHALTFSEFADTVKRSVRYIYEAVANPVEGTMLTVISDWADFLYSRREKLKDFDQAILDSMAVLEESLQETRIKLKVLQTMNFVDAGAKGFVLFIEGVIDLIHSKNLRSLTQELPQPFATEHSEPEETESITYRYCTEALITNRKQDATALQGVLRNFGDSIVVAGSALSTRIHVHTNSPTTLFLELKEFGTLTYQKVDDMIRQNEVTSKRKWNIALVTDSTCDLSQELIDRYQIHVVPINLNFGDNHYLDKVTITPDQFYEQLENCTSFPKTSQINERVFTNLYSFLATHYDAVVSIHLSGQLSGTFQSSSKAAARISKESGKPVHAIDSRTLTGSLGLIVLRTAMAIENGSSLAELLDLTAGWIKKTRVFVSVKTMKFMVRGGRVSRPKGWIAGLLNLKPIVTLDDNGKAVLTGKTFSQLSNVRLVMKKVASLVKEEPVWNYIVMHAHDPAGASIYCELMRQVTGREPLSVEDISPVIGINAGVGATAVSIMFE